MEFQGKDTGERSFRERDSEQNRLDHLRDQYYKIYFTPYSAELIATAAESSLNSNPALLFNTATNDGGRWTFTKPALWRRGEVNGKVYYATDGTHTGNVALQLTCRSIGVVDNALSNVNIVQETVTQAGSGVTNTLYEMDFSTQVNDLLDTYDVLAVSVKRLNASDTNTDDVYMFGGYVEFLPKFRQ